MTAVLIHSITAWVFGLQVARPFWHTALMAPLFVSSALVSELALVMIIVVLLRKLNVFPFDTHMLKKMGKLLAILTAVVLYFVLCELLTHSFHQTPEGLGALVLLFKSAASPWFLLEVLMSAAAFGILISRRAGSSVRWITLASFMLLFSPFLKRANFVLTGFVLPAGDYAGPTTGPASPNVHTFMDWVGSGYPYFPSISEWGISIGIVAFGVILFVWGFSKLPLHVKT